MENTKLNKMEKTNIFLLSLFLLFSALFFGTIQNNNVLADTIQPSQGQLSLENFVDATDDNIFGTNALVPNSEENQSNKLGVIVTKAIQLGKSVFVPQGTYYMEYNRVFNSNTMIIGDENGATIFKNRTQNDINFGSYQQYGNRTGITLRNLFFDGISIKADMFNNMRIDGCVFYNPVSDFQISVRYSQNLNIKNNIFLRDVDHAKSQSSNVGGASWNHTIFLSGYTTATNGLNQYQTNTLVQNNLIGAKIDELDTLKYVIPGAKDLFNTITRLQHALEEEKSISLEKNEQNIISTGINSFSTLKKAKILNNIFYSNKDNEETNGHILQDHVTYLRGASDVVIAGNHVRGWFNGSYGGFKFKSGVDITIMNNYMRNTGIIMTDDPEIGPLETASRVSILKNFHVDNNTFDFKYWDGGYRIGMEFSAQQSSDKTSISNGVFIDNRYIHFSNTKKADLLLYNPTTKTGFLPSNNSFVKGNTRDDGAHNGFSIVYGWTDSDYANMKSEWESIYKPEGYDDYLMMPIPEKNTLPIAVPTKIMLGDRVDPISLVSHFEDKDEIKPVAKILNSDLLEVPGNHKIQVELNYVSGFTCIINVPVNVEVSASSQKIK